MRDLHRELEEQGDGTWPPSWNPQPGETLVGAIRLFSAGPGKYGKPVRTCIIQREGSGDRVSLWISSAVLTSLFEQHRPQVGERVGLRYLGKDEQKGYRRYSMVVDRAPDYGPLGGESDEDADEGHPPPVTQATPRSAGSGSTPYARATVTAPAKPSAAPQRPAPPRDPRDPFDGDGPPPCARATERQWKPPAGAGQR